MNTQTITVAGEFLPEPLQAQLREAVKQVINTAFECGEWDRNESDESWGAVYRRATAANGHLFALLGIPQDAPGTETVLSPLDKIGAAIVHLRSARDLLSSAGAPKATDKVRSALKSAQGAERHALHAPYREARKAQDPALELEMFRRVNR